MTQAPADDLLGRTVLDRYRIVRRLARGGMGAVYLARTEGAEGFARPVVAKRVLPTLMKDAEVAQLFVREARLLSELQHPNIVGVLDFGKQRDGSYVTILEYVNGYSLDEWCRYLKGQRRLMPIESALFIVMRMLDALQYAHTFRRLDGTERQIIHRDVSPANVLLSDQGTVKLLDFGIAQVTGDAGEGSKPHARIRGKLPYVPLEIFKGQPATVQSDVYSAGVVLYEALTAIHPFAGREAADIFHKVATVSPASIHAARDDAPEEIDAVLSRALARDPARRFRSAAEFAEALRKLRDDPQEAVAKRLGEQLREDFYGPLPAALGVEPLAAREAAWRDAETPVPEGEDVAVTDPPSGPIIGPRFSVAPHEAVTAETDVSPLLLAGAARAPDPEPQKPGSSARRIAWIAAISSLIGAGAAALLWTAMTGASSPPPVVVIERAPAAAAHAQPAAAAPAAAKAAPAQAAPAAPAEPVADEQEAVEPTEPTGAPALAKREPPPAPNPRALTRAFERRQRQVEGCFTQHASALQGQPEMSLHFRVGEKGEVLSADLTPAALSSTALGHCLLQVATTTRFQPQQHEIAFRIPIVAQPGR